MALWRAGRTQQELPMPAIGLSHVNIATRDIEGTKRFYKALLGLVDGDTSDLPPTAVAHWLADPEGRSIIHLQRPRERHEGRIGEPTGAIDHVAFDCTDFDGMVAHCEALGVPCRINAMAGAAFRQIFVTDPNNVLLELNFRG
jgi:catechol 2,3-dioxygenase-like lactoylglutathione lyase family enzyme